MKEDNTCYIERTKVREILITSNANNDTTRELLAEVDALPIFVASDFAAVAQAYSGTASAIRDYLQTKYGTAAVQVSSDGIERIYYNGVPLSDLAAAISGAAQAGTDPLTRRERAEMIWAVLKSYMLDECSFDCAAVSPADEKNLINEIYNSIPSYSAPLTKRSEEGRLRYVMQKIAEFPYIGEKAAQQMQLLAKGALAIPSADRGGINRE